MCKSLYWYLHFEPQPKFYGFLLLFSLIRRRVVFQVNGFPVSLSRFILRYCFASLPNNSCETCASQHFLSETASPSTLGSSGAVALLSFQKKKGKKQVCLYVTKLNLCFHARA